MSKYPGVKRLPSGGIEYRGKKFAGFNKPKRSDRPGKKGMVLAKEGERIKLIHYGDSSMGHNYSPEARKSFKARHKKNIQKGLLRGFFGTLGRPERPFQFFGVFSLSAPTLVMSKGLLTFAGPQNAQNNDFLVYTKTWSDLKNFDQI